MAAPRARGARQLLIAVALLLGASCDRTATLNLYFDPQTCGRDVPAGGSILFEYDVGELQGLCPSCIDAPNTITDASELTAAVRKGAATCPGIAPGAKVRVSVVGRPFACATDRPPPTSVFCSKSAPFALGDGTSDATVLVTLTCGDCTTNPPCTPISSCAIDICGVISDGCGGTLDCGDPCQPPLKCRGGQCTK